MIHIELLLACDKNTLRNLLNTCKEINNLANEHFWMLRLNDVKTDETWLKSYKRLTINYGTVNGKNNIIKHINNYYLTNDNQLFQDDQLIFNKVKDFFIDDMIIILTNNNDVFRSRSTYKLNFEKIAKNVSKLFYSRNRNDIFYTDKLGTYRIGGSYQGYKIEKFLDFEVLDLWVKLDNELMGRIYVSYYITKDGNFGSAFLGQVAITQSKIKFIALLLHVHGIFLLADTYQLYSNTGGKIKRVRSMENIVKIYPNRYLTKDDKLYNFESKLLAENVVNYYNDEYVIKNF